MKSWLMMQNRYKQEPEQGTAEPTPASPAGGGGSRSDSGDLAAVELRAQQAARQEYRQVAREQAEAAVNSAVDRLQTQEEIRRSLQSINQRLEAGGQTAGEIQSLRAELRELRDMITEPVEQGNPAPVNPPTLPTPSPSPTHQDQQEREGTLSRRKGLFDFLR